MLPQDRAASSPSPSPCTPCPRCCAPEQTEKHVSHIVKHKINKQIEEKSLSDLIFKVVKVEAEQVGEPCVVAHDELHLGRISKH